MSIITDCASFINYKFIFDKCSQYIYHHQDHHYHYHYHYYYYHYYYQDLRQMSEDTKRYIHCA